jgi:hypothetical protein
MLEGALPREESLHCKAAHASGRNANRLPPGDDYGQNIQARMPSTNAHFIV